MPTGKAMMVISIFSIWILSSSAASVAMPREKCPPKLVKPDHSFRDCDVQGWVQAPAHVKPGIFKNVATEGRCAGLCLANPACLSFRYVETSKMCYLFAKNIYDMAFDGYNYLPGRYFQRDCYSEDCQIQEACTAFQSCEVTGGRIPHQYYEITYYASICTYGLTSNFKHAFKQTLFPGNWTACKAINKCTHRYIIGAFQVHYYKPSNQWVCRTYQDTQTYDPLVHGNFLEPKTFTVRNSSVGKSYGFWVGNIYYPD